MDTSVQNIPSLLRRLSLQQGEVVFFRKPKAPISWYPYADIMEYVEKIREVMTDSEFDARFVSGARVLDVGAADGDLSFYLESLGCKVDAIDNPSTNFNRCEGIKTLHKVLRSNVRLLIQDVDRAFTLQDQYDMTIACGILYHLRDPIHFLTMLALHGERMILSTRIASRLPGGSDISQSPVAYLLGHDESANKDPTNYWIFSKPGLFRCLARSGWKVANAVLSGEEEGDPVDKDTRIFVYCQRVPNYKELLIHHGF